MKRYPLLMLIIVSVLIMTGVGCAMRTGQVVSGNADEVNFRVPAAVDSVRGAKMLASEYSADAKEKSDAKEEMLELARASSRENEEGSDASAKEDSGASKPSDSTEGKKTSGSGNTSDSSGASGSSDASDGKDDSEEEEPKEEEPEEEEERVYDNEEPEEEEEPEVLNDPSHPDFQTVGEDYFLDACFIGDSRTQGFGLYSGVETTIYAKQGLQLYRVFQDKVVPSPAGKLTIPEALASGVQFKKIYLMFGLNELGWGNNEMFADEYYDLIDVIKALQPDAVVYVQQIIHVTKSKDRDSSVFTNERIDARNEVLREVAANEHVYYLELNEVFTDEDNCLPSNYASDGIHLSAQYISVWKDYLLTHAIVQE